MIHAGSVFLFSMAVCAAASADAPTVLEGPEIRDDGILNYLVTSPHQKRPTTIEVLLPDKGAEGGPYPALYILPVNDGLNGAWGSGIQEAKRHNIHNLYNVVCVSPEYDYTPWFGDHPTDPALAQESYLLKAVIPLVEKHCPVLKGKDGRLLLGFSKSGFGAITIFLRNTDFIGKSAAWDAPLTMKRILPKQEEMKVVFVDQENFDGYCIPGLVEKQATALRGDQARIVLVSNANPYDSISALHTLLDTHKIPHRYQVDQKRKHDWRTDWFPVVCQLLFTPEGEQPGRVHEKE